MVYPQRQYQVPPPSLITVILLYLSYLDSPSNLIQKLIYRKLAIIGIFQKLVYFVHCLVNIIRPRTFLFWWSTKTPFAVFVVHDIGSNGVSDVC